jgi:hypothetical protein
VTPRLLGVPKTPSDLCLPKILSGANAFDISDIQEDEIEAALTRDRIEQCYGQNFGVPHVTLTISESSSHRLLSPEVLTCIETNRATSTAK